MSEITIVVPTHNRVELVQDVLDRIVGQHDVDVEVVVVDDGSSDGTAEQVRARGDDRIRVVRHEQAQGLPAARNRGMEEVRTAWVAFSDDDDLWAPDKLRSQLDALRASGGAWCAVGTIFVDERLQVIGHSSPPTPEELLDQIFRRNPIPAGGSGVVARTDLVRDAGGFDPALRSCEDWDLWIRLALRARYTAVDRPLVAYRIWPKAMSSHADRMAEAFDTVSRRYARAAAARGVRPDVAAHERYLASRLAGAGQRVPAARRYLRLAAAGHARDAVRAAATLLSPTGAVSTGRERALRRVPAAWLDEAAPWLTPSPNPLAGAHG